MIRKRRSNGLDISEKKGATKKAPVSSSGSENILMMGSRGIG